MPQIPNATAERIGVGGIVKLSSPCTVIIEKVGTGNIATVDGRSVYEFTEVGDYIFESTCECTGFYAITERGVLTGCCPVFSAPDPDTGLVTVIDENDTLLVTIPTKSTVSQQTDGGFIATNPDGSVIGPWYTDTVVTYTWTETNPVDGDGIVEWTATPSDGSAPASDHYH